MGAAIAQELATLGCAVPLLDLDERGCQDVVGAIEGAGGGAIPFGADVTDEEAVTAAVAGAPTNWVRRPCWSTTLESSGIPQPQQQNVRGWLALGHDVHRRCKNTRRTPGSVES